MLAVLPLPNQFSSPGVPLTVNNYAATIKSTSSADSGDVRVDEILSAKSTLFGRYRYRQNTSLTSLNIWPSSPLAARGPRRPVMNMILSSAMRTTFDRT